VGEALHHEYLVLTIDGGEWLASCPCCLKEPQYQLDRLDGPQGWSECCGAEINFLSLWEIKLQFIRYPACYFVIILTELLQEFGDKMPRRRGKVTGICRMFLHGELHYLSLRIIGFLDFVHCPVF
jgi:hypothetical protein